MYVIFAAIFSHQLTPITSQQQKQKSREIKLEPSQAPKPIAASAVKAFYSIFNCTSVRSNIILQISPNVVNEWISEATTRYPENVDNSQLKTLLGHLEEPFEGVRNADRVCNSAIVHRQNTDSIISIGNGSAEQPSFERRYDNIRHTHLFFQLLINLFVDFPLSILSKDIRRSLEEFLETKKPNEIVSFFWYLVEQLIGFDDGRDSVVAACGCACTCLCILCAAFADVCLGIERMLECIFAPFLLMCVRAITGMLMTDF